MASVVYSNPIHCLGWNQTSATQFLYPMLRLSGLHWKFVSTRVCGSAKREVYRVISQLGLDFEFWAILERLMARKS
jgi:hypothetical protein